MGSANDHFYTDPGIPGGGCIGLGVRGDAAGNQEDSPSSPGREYQQAYRAEAQFHHYRGSRIGADRSRRR